MMFQAVLVAALAISLLACSPEKSSMTESGEVVVDDNTGDLESAVFELLQNSPNPFQHSTLIRFRVEKTVFVQVRVNLRGSGNLRVVNELKQGPAIHYVTFVPPANTPSGDYGYSMEVNGKYQLKTMTIER